MKKIGIIGAGPGGLAAGMVLSKKGYDIHIYEKDNQVGGRSKQLTLGDYRFDVGPTFLMYLEILEEVFKAAGYDLHKELDLIRLEELYTLMFNDVTFHMSQDPAENAKMYDKYQPGMGESYLKWLKAQEKKLNAIAPILKKPFPNVFHFLRPDVIKAAPYAHIFQSVYTHLSTFNKNENFIHSLSFQAKYLGMASYQAPSIFTILPYLEHAMGLYHVKGGLNQINHKMAELIEKNGGQIHLNQSVEEIIVDKGVAKGLRVNGEAILFDEIIINADFAYSMNKLIKPEHLKKYTPEKLQKKKYSVSTFMLYIGLNKEYDFAHHEILFSKDYEAYLKGLTTNQFTDDFSVYVHNPGRTDDSYAPKGHTSLFVLVPVPNTQAKQDWSIYQKHLKEKTLDLIESKHGVDLRSHIQVIEMLNPTDWEQDFNVHYGAVFNLAHNLPQMLHRRPHNQFEDISHVYLVGGGTHPGSGLPTIYQSALILKHYL